MTQVLDTRDPKYYVDAHGKPKCEQDMQHEIDSLEKNHTWDLVPPLTRKNVVKCQWVYRIKFTSNGVVEYHKAYLVTKSFYYKEGIDYTNTFSLVAKMNFVQLIFSLVSRFGWLTHHMDIKSAFSPW